MSEQELTKLTVNLVPGAVVALNKAAEIEQLSKTDTVNRALQVWACLLAEQAKGFEVHLVTRRRWFRSSSRRMWFL